MTTHVYTIRALTNLHAGSGQAGYGIVDKLVQRDPATNHPTVHMSGIKGALRQYLEDNATIPAADLTRIFGSSVKESAKNIQQGKVHFISADLLAFPVPTTGTNNTTLPFELITTEQICAAFDAKVGCFTKWNNWAGAQVQTEGTGAWRNDPTEFSRQTDELPVVARNYLNDGISENLWYEEFVPREAVFGTIIQGPEDCMNLLAGALHKQVVQLGANATVGYGYCLFERLNA